MCVHVASSIRTVSAFGSRQQRQSVAHYISISTHPTERVPEIPHRTTGGRTTAPSASLDLYHEPHTHRYRIRYTPTRQSASPSAQPLHSTPLVSGYARVNTAAIEGRRTLQQRRRCRTIIQLLRPPCTDPTCHDRLFVSTCGYMSHATQPSRRQPLVSHHGASGSRRTTASAHCNLRGKSFSATTRDHSWDEHVTVRSLDAWFVCVRSSDEMLCARCVT